MHSLNRTRLLNTHLQAKGAWGRHVQSEALKAKAAAAAARAASKAGDASIEMGSKLAVQAAAEAAEKGAMSATRRSLKKRGKSMKRPKTFDTLGGGNDDHSQESTESTCLNNS